MQSLILIGVGILLILLVCGLRLFSKKLSAYDVDPTVCRELVYGTVIGGSNIHYAGHRTAKVSYEVDGQTYEVEGPLFKSGTTSPFTTSNLTSQDNLPDRIKGPSVPGASDRDMEMLDPRYEDSVVAQLYPIGSQAPVYYNSNDPSQAFVQRYVKPNADGILILNILMLTGIIVSILCIVVGIVFM